MATEVKVIKVRRGPYTDFDKTKMNAGEPAITTSGDPNTLDGRGIYMGVGAGQVKQIATIEDIQDTLNDAVDGAVDEATQQAEEEADRAEAAATQLASTVTQVATNTADIAQLNERIDNLNPITDDIKEALLDCFEHVAWIDEHGQDYYDALRLALYPNTIVSITAVLSLGTHQVFMNDDIESLRDYLTVTANYADGTQGAITNYELSGDIASEGTKTITVNAENKTTTFDCPVTWGYRITQQNGLLQGTLVNTYRNWQTLHYVATENPQRVCNLNFLPWEAGYDCYVEADTDLSIVASVNVYNQIAMNSVANNQDINTNNIGLPGWQSSNPSLTNMPDTVNNSPTKAVRVVFKTVPTESEFSVNSISEVRITRRTKA